MKLDYSELRLKLKLLLRQQEISPCMIDHQYKLYYDETGNIKKFYLDEQGKPNVENDPIFVLGGLEGKSEEDLEYFKNSFNLQNNILEIKSKYLTKTSFEDTLDHRSLNKYLDLILSKGWHAHFVSLNFRYWSLVDILDSVNYFKELNYELQNEVKAVLYRISQIQGEDFYRFLARYNYPDINDGNQLHHFFIELKDIVHITKLNNLPFSSDHKEFLMLTLLKGAEQEQAMFLQHNIPLMLLEQLTEWYRAEIYTWKNCELVFDNENDIIDNIDKSEIILDGEPLKNYRFLDSKNEIMVQLSDVMVKLITQYLKFIDKYNYIVPENVSKFNERQVENFYKLNRILYDSREFNPVFFHQTNSIIQNGLFNCYIEKYR